MTLPTRMKQDLTTKLAHDFVGKLRLMQDLVVGQGGSPADLADMAIFAIASTFFAAAETLGTDVPGAKGEIIKLFSAQAQRVGLELLLSFSEKETEVTALGQR